MKTMETENFITNSSEPNGDKINNINQNEITILYLYDNCQAVMYIILTILIFPLFFFKFLILTPYKQVIRVDKKKKVLFLGTKGMGDCCSCCISYALQYDLEGIKNVKLKIKEVNGAFKKIFSVSSDKVYFIECEVYSLSGESSRLFKNIRYKKDKYNELVLFFKQFTEVIEEKVQPLNNIKTDNDIPSENEITTRDEQNNIESKPSFNEAAPMPVMT